MSENTEAKTMLEETDPEANKKLKWAAFVESALVDFFSSYKLEKITVEDGNGNKAKLSRTKDNELKIEQSSITII